MSTINDLTRHGTTQELEFLDNLGFHNPQNNFDRAVLLNNYIEAAPLRTNWGNIDKGTALAHARRLLHGEALNV